MKIYTKKGDKGETSLFGGQRVKKDTLRIEAYGTVDELNSVIGQVLAFEPCNTIQSILQKLQNDLFILGADLATPPSKELKISRISEEQTKQLELWIDKLDAELEPLKYFILPGGSKAGSTLHVARTICRRAERASVSASKIDHINEEVITYLNRLSDLLFVMARFENMSAGIPEEKWKVS